MLRLDKTRKISVRLVSDSYDKLKQLAERRDTGVYALARELLAVAIDDEDELDFLQGLTKSRGNDEEEQTQIQTSCAGGS